MPHRKGLKINIEATIQAANDEEERYYAKAAAAKANMALAGGGGTSSSVGSPPHLRPQMSARTSSSVGQQRSDGQCQRRGSNMSGIVATSSAAVTRCSSTAAGQSPTNRSGTLAVTNRGSSTPNCFCFLCSNTQNNHNINNNNITNGNRSLTDFLTSNKLHAGTENTVIDSASFGSHPGAKVHHHPQQTSLEGDGNDARRRYPSEAGASAAFVSIAAIAGAGPNMTNPAASHNNTHYTQNEAVVASGSIHEPFNVTLNSASSLLMLSSARNSQSSHHGALMPPPPSSCPACSYAMATGAHAHTNTMIGGGTSGDTKIITPFTSPHSSGGGGRGRGGSGATVQSSSINSEQQRVFLHSSPPLHTSSVAGTWGHVGGRQSRGNSVSLDIPPPSCATVVRSGDNNNSRVMNRYADEPSAHSNSPKAVPRRCPRCCPCCSCGCNGFYSSTTTNKNNSATRREEVFTMCTDNSNNNGTTQCNVDLTAVPLFDGVGGREEEGGRTTRTTPTAAAQLSPSNTEDRHQPMDASSPHKFSVQSSVTKKITTPSSAFPHPLSLSLSLSTPSHHPLTTTSSSSPTVTAATANDIANNDIPDRNPRTTCRSSANTCTNNSFDRRSPTQNVAIGHQPPRILPPLLDTCPNDDNSAAPIVSATLGVGPHGTPTLFFVSPNHPNANAASGVSFETDEGQKEHAPRRHSSQKTTSLNSSSNLITNERDGGHVLTNQKSSSAEEQAPSPPQSPTMYCHCCFSGACCCCAFSIAKFGGYQCTGVASSGTSGAGAGAVPSCTSANAYANTATTDAAQRFERRLSASRSSAITSYRVPSFVSTSTAAVIDGNNSTSLTKEFENSSSAHPRPFPRRRDSFSRGPHNDEGGGGRVHVLSPVRCPAIVRPDDSAAADPFFSSGCAPLAPFPRHWFVASPPAAEGSASTITTLRGSPSDHHLGDLLMAKSVGSFRSGGEAEEMSLTIAGACASIANNNESTCQSDKQNINHRNHHMSRVNSTSTVAPHPQGDCEGTDRAGEADRHVESLSRNEEKEDGGRGPTNSNSSISKQHQHYYSHYYYPTDHLFKSQTHNNVVDVPQYHGGNWHIGGGGYCTHAAHNNHHHYYRDTSGGGSGGNSDNHQAAPSGRKRPTLTPFPLASPLAKAGAPNYKEEREKAFASLVAMRSAQRREGRNHTKEDNSTHISSDGFDDTAQQGLRGNSGDATYAEGNEGNNYEEDEDSPRRAYFDRFFYLENGEPAFAEVDVVGKGAGGYVRKVQHRVTGRMLAIKEIRCINVAQLDQTRSEIQHLHEVLAQFEENNNDADHGHCVHHRHHHIEDEEEEHLMMLADGKVTSRIASSSDNANVNCINDGSHQHQQQQQQHPQLRITVASNSSLVTTVNSSSVVAVSATTAADTMLASLTTNEGLASSSAVFNLQHLPSHHNGSASAPRRGVVMVGIGGVGGLPPRNPSSSTTGLNGQSLLAAGKRPSSSSCHQEGTPSEDLDSVVVPANANTSTHCGESESRRGSVGAASSATLYQRFLALQEQPIPSMYSVSVLNSVVESDSVNWAAATAAYRKQAYDQLAPPPSQATKLNPSNESNVCPRAEAVESVAVATAASALLNKAVCIDATGQNTATCTTPPVHCSDLTLAQRFLPAGSEVQDDMHAHEQKEDGITKNWDHAKEGGRGAHPLSSGRGGGGDDDEPQARNPVPPLLPATGDVTHTHTSSSGDTPLCYTLSPNMTAAIAGDGEFREAGSSSSRAQRESSSLLAGHSVGGGTMAVGPVSATSTSVLRYDSNASHGYNSGLSLTETIRTGTGTATTCGGSSSKSLLTTTTTPSQTSVRNPKSLTINVEIAEGLRERCDYQQSGGHDAAAAPSSLPLVRSQQANTHATAFTGSASSLCRPPLSPAAHMLHHNLLAAAGYGSRSFGSLNTNSLNLIDELTIADIVASSSSFGPATRLQDPSTTPHAPSTLLMAKLSPKATAEITKAAIVEHYFQETELANLQQSSSFCVSSALARLSPPASPVTSATHTAPKHVDVMNMHMVAETSATVALPNADLVSAQREPEQDLANNNSNNEKSTVVCIGSGGDNPATQRNSPGTSAPDNMPTREMIQPYTGHKASSATGHHGTVFGGHSTQNYDKIGNNNAVHAVVTPTTTNTLSTSTEEGEEDRSIEANGYAVSTRSERCRVATLLADASMPSIMLNPLFTRSKHIVRSFAVTVHDQSMFVAMELLDGSLDSIRERALRLAAASQEEDQESDNPTCDQKQEWEESSSSFIPEPILASFAHDLLRGLDHLHRERRIVHRDIKPPNLLFSTRKGTVKIADFGICTSLGHGKGGVGVGSSRAKNRSNDKKSSRQLARQQKRSQKRSDIAVRGSSKAAIRGSRRKDTHGGENAASSKRTRAGAKGGVIENLDLYLAEDTSGGSDSDSGRSSTESTSSDSSPISDVSEFTTGQTVSPKSSGSSNTYSTAVGSAQQHPVSPSNHDRNSFVGTVSYMSPERLTGKPYDATSDVWAAGITLLELGIGVHPFHYYFSKSRQARMQTLPSASSAASAAPARNATSSSNNLEAAVKKEKGLVESRSLIESRLGQQDSTTATTSEKSTDKHISNTFGIGELLTPSGSNTNKKSQNEDGSLPAVTKKRKSLAFIAGASGPSNLTVEAKFWILHSHLGPEDPLDIPTLIARGRGVTEENEAASRAERRARRRRTTRGTDATASLFKGVGEEGSLRPNAGDWSNGNGKENDQQLPIRQGVEAHRKESKIGGGGPEDTFPSPIKRLKNSTPERMRGADETDESEITVPREEGYERLKDQNGRGGQGGPMSDHRVAEADYSDDDDSSGDEEPIASPDFLDFISLCLEKRPEKRLSAAALLRHPFVKRRAKHSEVASYLSHLISSTADDEKKSLQTK